MGGGVSSDGVYYSPFVDGIPAVYQIKRILCSTFTGCT